MLLTEEDLIPIINKKLEEATFIDIQKKKNDLTVISVDKYTYNISGRLMNQIKFDKEKYIRKSTIAEDYTFIRYTLFKPERYPQYKDMTPKQKKLTEEWLKEQKEQFIIIDNEVIYIPV